MSRTAGFLPTLKWPGFSDKFTPANGRPSESLAQPGARSRAGRTAEPEATDDPPGTAPGPELVGLRAGAGPARRACSLQTMRFEVCLQTMRFEISIE